MFDKRGKNKRIHFNKNLLKLLQEKSVINYEKNRKFKFIRFLCSSNHNHNPYFLRHPMVYNFPILYYEP